MEDGEGSRGAEANAGAVDGLPALARGSGMDEGPSSAPPRASKRTRRVRDTSSSSTYSCSHEMVTGGICCECSESVDVSSLENKNKYIKFEHAMQKDIYVKRKVAAKIEMEEARLLIEKRKLSLVLDIDHTLLHATQSPYDRNKPHPTPPPVPEVIAWQDPDPRLGRLHDFQLPKCNFNYYVKLRPGLFSFLEEVSKLFVLHIYTFGTQEYAKKISEIIDPSKHYFHERIAAREEMQGDRDPNRPPEPMEKKLERLFPCDTSMVLIIDDRNDVWKSSKNLLQIQPYTFFLDGPEVNNAAGASLPGPARAPGVQRRPGVSRASAAVSEPSFPSAPASLSPTQSASSSSPPQAPSSLVSPQPSSSNAVQTPTVETPLEPSDDGQVDDSQSSGGGPANSASASPSSNNSPPPPITLEFIPPSSISRWQYNITEDLQLSYMLRVLKEVHSRFFAVVDRERSRGSNFPSSSFPDVREILENVRREVLQGVHCVFSGVFPTNMPPSRAQAWQLAETFGAQCHTEISPVVTHLIAMKPGTAKVTQALTCPTIRIVHLNWLWEAAKSWKRPNEADFSLGVAGLPDSERTQQRPNTLRLETSQVPPRLTTPAPAQQTSPTLPSSTTDTLPSAPLTSNDREEDRSEQREPASPASSGSLDSDEVALELENELFGET